MIYIAFQAAAASATIHDMEIETNTEAEDMYLNKTPAVSETKSNEINK